ncbi:MAG: cysteine desulfurase family protein [Chthoniobacterales bacterium]
MTYLDYNATTPLAPEAMEAMLPFLREDFGNPSSIHAHGRRARAAVDDSRDSIAKLLGAKSHEIIFTGGGTESDNLAIIGLARDQATKGKHLITSPTEHHAVLHAFEFLQKAEGFEVTLLPVDSDGRIDPEELRRAIRKDTTLASIMTANNETGTLQPIPEFSAICRENGVLFHTDAVQSFGKEPVVPKDLGVDALSLAGHKFYGPKGAGILYLKAGISISKLHHGGFHENQRRPGTENVAAIVGMARAAELVLQGWEVEQARLAALRDLLQNGIQAICPKAVINGHPTLRIANTLNISIPGVDGESLLISLDLEGVGASSGSACMVGSVMPSHVLLARGVTEEIAKSTVRFSLGKQTDENAIKMAIDAFGSVWKRLGSRM